MSVIIWFKIRIEWWCRIFTLIQVDLYTILDFIRMSRSYIWKYMINTWKGRSVSAQIFFNIKISKISNRTEPFFFVRKTCSNILLLCLDFVLELYVVCTKSYDINCSASVKCYNVVIVAWASVIAKINRELYQKFKVIPKFGANLLLFNIPNFVTILKHWLTLVL